MPRQTAVAPQGALTQAERARRAHAGGERRARPGAHRHARRRASGLGGCKPCGGQQQCYQINSYLPFIDKGLRPKTPQISRHPGSCGRPGIETAVSCRTCTAQHMHVMDSAARPGARGLAHHAAPGLNPGRAPWASGAPEVARAAAPTAAGLLRAKPRKPAEAACPPG